jgi:hypothetical protein
MAEEVPGEMILGYPSAVARPAVQPPFATHRG